MAALALIPAACSGDAATAPGDEMMMMADAGAGDTGAATFMASLCNQPGATGPNVGDQFPNVSLTDCDGNTYPLSELCGERASWMFVFAGW